MKKVWCDFSCKHASFPKQSALQGACNTLQAIYCRKHGKLVPKNGRCLDSHATLKER